MSPEQQGYAPHGRHVLLAVNVLHDARNLIESLAHLRRLLRPGGILIVVEATANGRLQFITAGFSKGSAILTISGLKGAAADRRG